MFSNVCATQKLRLWAARCTLAPCSLECRWHVLSAAPFPMALEALNGQAYREVLGAPPIPGALQTSLQHVFPGEKLQGQSLLPPKAQDRAQNSPA